MTDTNTTVCVIGLGYVGLPLAEAFSKYFCVIGFDVDGKKLAKLKKDKRLGRNAPYWQNRVDSVVMRVYKGFRYREGAGAILRKGT
ncbi:MAG: hypothetical protein PHQ43_13500 [Dehalococcoidales bacterium]|nr:hypothetical protein [Dehalococcoidales bacterium]